MLHQALQHFLLSVYYETRMRLIQKHKLCITSQPLFQLYSVVWWNENILFPIPQIHWQIRPDTLYFEAEVKTA